MTVKLEKLRKKLYPKLLDALVQHPEAIDAYERGAMAKLASELSVAGFRLAFELIIGEPLLDHWEEPVGVVFDAHEENLGVVIEAFRGAAKTTTFTIALASWLVGMFPEKAGLLIQVGDDIAKDNSKQVADIIEHNPGWKAIFPHIAPDKEQGWGAAGYEVKRTDMPYDEWRSLNAMRKDPSFVGLGYNSSSIIGKRPYWLVVDDIHDEKNTASERMMRATKTILKGTILPAANFSKWRTFIGTPWNESDALHYCLTTGEFKHVKIPVIKDGEPVWPEVFSLEEIERQRQLVGEIEFARMYLLDLSKTKGLTLKNDWLSYWPHQEISPDWPRYMGVDYTSTADPRKEAGDYFALAVGAIIPGGRGMVVEDGVYDKMSQAEAEDTVVAWTGKYPTLILVGVEAVFSGNEFYNMLLNNAELRGNGVVPHPCRPRKSKGYRFEKLLAPMFQRNRIYLSDEENKFLDAFVDEWMNWQGDALESAYNNDALDAVFNLSEVAQAFIAPLPPSARKTTNPLFKNREDRIKNPIASLGRR